MSEPRRPVSVRPVVLWLIAVAALNMSRFADPSYAVDDAWISFRVARTLLESGKLTFDAAMPPVEGMTNLLWTLLTASWVRLPVDPIGPARCVGAVCHLSTIAVLSYTSASITQRLGGRPPVAAGVTGLVLATSGTLAFHAVSGLETAFYGLLLALGGSALVRGRHLRGGLCLGLAAMTRPEGVLLGGLALLGLVACRAPRAAVLRTGLPFLVIVASLEGFRLAYYGQLVPNTFFAKPPGLDAGLVYLAGGVAWGTGGLGLLGVVPIAVRHRGAAFGAAALLALLAAVAWSGGDWMPGARRLTEVLLVAAPLLGVGAGLATGLRGWLLPGTATLAWVAGNLAGAVRGWDSSRFEHAYAAAMGEAAAASSGVHTVALGDIGRFGWTFSGSILDLAGLTDAHIAHLDGSRGAKAWDEGYFRERAPDLVLVRCETEITDPLLQAPRILAGEQPLLLSILDHGGYRYHGQYPLSPGHWMLVFPRDGLTLDPHLWGPRSARDLREILSGPP